MKVYIAGPITNDPDYKKKFDAAARAYEAAGHLVMNPTCLPLGFEHQDYIHICKAMIEVCDMVAFLPGWEDSKGACLEMAHALNLDKRIELKHLYKRNGAVL